MHAPASRDCGGDECIYRVFEPISEKIPPRPHHVSSFAEAVRYEMGPGKRTAKHRTMGVAEVKVRNPKEYLKRGEGGISSQAPRPAQEHRRFRPGLARPPKMELPPRQDKKPKELKESKGGQAMFGGVAVCMSGSALDEGPAPGVDTGAEGDNAGGRAEKYDFNFRVQNIKTVMKQMTRHPQIRVADTRRGDTYALAGSGLFPTYVYSEKYGKVPKYIVRRAEEMALAKQAILDAQANKQPKCRYITQHERLELLDGLKANWEQVTSAYNKQSVLIDNASKVARKARLENELKRLEKDILTLEGHPYIYVHLD